MTLRVIFCYFFGMQPASTTDKIVDPQDLLRRSEGSIWLDGYDDIFSDFDPRPYTQRTISDDFILTVRKAIQTKKNGALELTLLLAKASRDEKTETLVRKRIIGHFQSQLSRLELDIKRMHREGLVLTLSSILVLFVAVTLPMLGMNEYLKNLLQVILTPGGWFMIFNGLDYIVYKPRQKRADAEYCRKLSRCRITFLDY